MRSEDAVDFKVFWPTLIRESPLEFHLHMENGKFPASREESEANIQMSGILLNGPLGTYHNGLGHNVMWHNRIRYNFKNEK